MRITRNTTGNLVGILSREDSRVWAGRATPDGRVLHEVRARNRDAMGLALLRRKAAIGQIFASTRQGGALLDEVFLDDAARRHGVKL